MRISPAYLEEQRRLHADPRGYGGRGDKWADVVAAIGAGMMAREVLDYGCGQNTLAVALRNIGFETRSYDPALPAFDAEPHPADLVVCTDVLEHVEEELVPAVLAHLAELTRRKLFVVVSLVETSKTLSDGRQAHITLKPPGWWVTGIEAVGLALERIVDVKKPGKEFAAVFKRKKA